MLDIGWSEMAMIALLALIVIGPKDLPRVMRTVGQWVRKARGFARDFQSSLDDMIEDDELREAKRSIEQETRKFKQKDAFGLNESLEKHVDPNGSLRDTARDIQSHARVTDADIQETGHATASSESREAQPETAVAEVERESEDKTPTSGHGGDSAGGDSSAPETSGATFVETQTPVAPGNSVHAGRSGRAASTDSTNADEDGQETGQGEDEPFPATGTSPRNA